MRVPVLTCHGSELAALRPPDPKCCATVIVPVRNEEAGLTKTLDALRLQRTLQGASLAWSLYEVILLLNNCTDGSGGVARRYVSDHPDFRLHVAHCELPPEQAHVGTARSMLMNCACNRLESQLSHQHNVMAILSTDADTLVASDWVASNLAELERGAEVVGGLIHLLPEELENLEYGTRLAYQRDLAFQARVAQLESVLDPDPADPWPRHLQHFGASLACTPGVYRRSGGLPPVKALEDMAFIDALRRKGAKIRHSLAVNIFTSARLHGRAEVGLSGQLRHWKRESDAGLPHMVDSAEWLKHRFKSLAALRRLNQDADLQLDDFPTKWRDRIGQLRDASLCTATFLERLDCDSLIEETFRDLPSKPQRHGEITEVIQHLDVLNAALSADLTCVPEYQAGSARDAPNAP